uniref:Uncharacterized protein n=1 Tax=Anguilla anguilla TaxID=7936 RepID=A0A0E9SDE6_ANGAN
MGYSSTYLVCTLCRTRGTLPHPFCVYTTGQGDG